MNIVQFTLVFLIRLYQKVLSPVLPALLGPSACCRFTPTCSQYAAQAIRLHGAFLGGWLAARRLCRCHPWGDAGEDPPPAAPMRWNAAFRLHGLRLPLLNLNPNPGSIKKIRIKSKIRIRRVTQRSEIRPRWMRAPLKARPPGLCHES